MTVTNYIYNLKQGLNSPFRILVFLGSVFLAVYIGSIPLRSSFVDSYLQSNALMNFIFLLLPFVFGFIAIVIFIKKCHNLSFRYLIIPIGSTRIDYKRILFSFSVWLLILSFAEFIGFFIDPDNYVFLSLNRDYIFLVFISLVFLPIQAGFEEILIRSYLTQQFQLYTGKILFSIIFGSVVFAAMHLNNPEVISFGLPIMFSYYFIAGLFLATIAYKDGRLELSLGVHAANNIFSAIIVSYTGSVFKTQTIAATIKMNAPLSLAGFCIAAIMFYFICKYKYKWGTDFEVKDKRLNQVL